MTLSDKQKVIQRQQAAEVATLLEPIRLYLPIMQLEERLYKSLVDEGHTKTFQLRKYLVKDVKYRARIALQCIKQAAKLPGAQETQTKMDLSDLRVSLYKIFDTIKY